MSAAVTAVAGTSEGPKPGLHVISRRAARDGRSRAARREKFSLSQQTLTGDEIGGRVIVHTVKDGQYVSPPRSTVAPQISGSRIEIGRSCRRDSSGPLGIAQVGLDEPLSSHKSWQFARLAVAAVRPRRNSRDRELNGGKIPLRRTSVGVADCAALAKSTTDKDVPSYFEYGDRAAAIPVPALLLSSFASQRHMLVLASVASPRTPLRAAFSSPSCWWSFE